MKFNLYYSCQTKAGKIISKFTGSLSFPESKHTCSNLAFLFFLPYCAREENIPNGEANIFIYTCICNYTPVRPSASKEVGKWGGKEGRKGGGREGGGFTLRS